MPYLSYRTSSFTLRLRTTTKIINNKIKDLKNEFGMVRLNRETYLELTKFMHKMEIWGRGKAIDELLDYWWSHHKDKE